MKRQLLTLILFLCVFILNAQTTFKYTSTNLNLREKPNTSGKVLTMLPKGTKVKIEENCNCEWILISYNGNIGYVYSKYLTTEQNINTRSTYSRNSSSKVKYYTNSSGEKVQSPTYYNSVPAGATALCRDGTYSKSKSRRGTCSHHGGVARWLK